MQSYYLGRLIDKHLQEAKERSSNKELSAHLTTQCIRKAEWEYQEINFDESIVKPLNKAGWSLDFVYLDQNTHRFEVQKQG